MKKLQVLEGFDIVILSLIFFGEAINLAIQGYLDLLNGSATLDSALDFSVQDDYSSLILQSGLLLIAFLYLYWRKFDFKVWTIKPSLKAFVQGIIMFIGAALLMDLFFMITQPIAMQLPFPMPLSEFIGQLRFSTVIYAFLNGFYEEIFFLGICMSVSRKDMRWVLPYAFFIRFIFHIYQGMLPAIGIGLVFGGYFYVLYKKSSNKNLFPFFIAHAIADILGLGLIYYLY